MITSSGMPLINSLETYNTFPVVTDSKTWISKKVHMCFGDRDTGGNGNDYFCDTSYPSLFSVDSGSILSDCPELIENGKFNELSDELIMNRSFNELGSDELTNGSFDTSTDWAMSNLGGTTGWRIENGQAIMDGSASDFKRTLTHATNFSTIGETYKVTLGLGAPSESGLAFSFTGEAWGDRTEIPTDTSGVYVFYHTATAVGSVFIYGGMSVNQIIDSISVEEVDPSDNWTLSNAKINKDGVTVTISGGAFSYLDQDESDFSFPYVDGKSYRMRATISGTVGGQVRFQDNSSNTGGLTSSNGKITLTGETQNIEIYWVANANSNTMIVARQSSLSDYIFTVSHISVVQLDPDDDWVLGAALGSVRYEADGLLVDKAGSATQSILTSGRTYKIDITLTHTGGIMRFKCGTNTSSTFSSSTSLYVTSNGADFLLDFLGSFEGTIHNVSISAVEENNFVPRHSQYIAPSSCLLTSVNGYINSVDSTGCAESTDEFTISIWKKSVTAPGTSATPINLLYSQSYIFPNSPSESYCLKIDTLTAPITYNSLTIINEGEGVICSIKRIGGESIGTCTGINANFEMTFELTDETTTEDFTLPVVGTNGYNRVTNVLSSPNRMNMTGE